MENAQKEKVVAQNCARPNAAAKTVVSVAKMESVLTEKAAAKKTPKSETETEDKPKAKAPRKKKSEE